MQNFLTSLYSEIAAAADDESLVFDANVLTLIRRARLGYFLTIRSKLGLQKVLHEFGSDTPRRLQSTTTQLLYTDLIAQMTLECSRLTKFYRDVGTVIMTVCVFSPTFREALREHTWPKIAKAISDQVHSIELFARTRKIAWFELLHAHDAYFSRLLNSKLNSLYPLLSEIEQATTTGRNLGISPEALLHSLPKARHSHEWILTGTTTPAKPTTLTYIATDDLFNSSLESSDVVVGAVYTVPQVNINDSISLTDYPWTHRYDWPKDNDDPRYYSGDSDPCLVCGEVQAWCKIATKQKNQTVRRSCDHEFADYQRLNNLSPVRVELTTTRFGTGVRALQNISAGSFLDVFVGEMYPSEKANGKAFFRPRYDGDMGRAYLYEQALSRRHLKKGKEGILVADFAPNEYKSFYIDPAVKGNWTRFMNHSCDPNTIFSPQNIGQRQLALVKATKDIAFGDEITIHYGYEYFNDKEFRCACGVDRCQMWELGQVGTGRRLTLAAARSANDPAIPGDLRLGNHSALNKGILSTKRKKRKDSTEGSSATLKKKKTFVKW